MCKLCQGSFKYIIHFDICGFSYKGRSFFCMEISTIGRITTCARVVMRPSGVCAPSTHWHQKGEGYSTKNRHGCDPKAQHRRWIYSVTKRRTEVPHEKITFVRGEFLWVIWRNLDGLMSVLLGKSNW